MPFLPAAIPWIVGGLGAAGAVGKGMAQNRQASNEANAQQDKTRLQMALFNRTNPSARASDAVRGDILNGAQDFTLSGEGRNLSGSGGLRPSLFSKGTRQLGQSMNRAAVLSQLKSSPLEDQPQMTDAQRVTTMQDAINKAKGSGQGLAGVINAAKAIRAQPGFVPQPAEDPYGSQSPTPYAKPGFLENALGVAGLAGNVAQMLPFGRPKTYSKPTVGPFDDIYGGS